MAATNPKIKSEPELLLERADLGGRIADIDRQLAALKAVSVNTWLWTSLSLPPDMQHLRDGRRAFATFLRTHEVVGKRLDGHVWSCPRHTYAEARRRNRARDVKPLDGDEALAQLAIESAGVRRTA